MLRIKFKKLHPSAKVPTKATPGAAGFDLYAFLIEPCDVFPGEVVSISSGVCVEIPYGFEAQVRGRSGLLMKHGIYVPQTGTIDSDYRGEVRVPLSRTDEFGRGYTVSNGDRIAQLVIAPVPDVEFVEVEELSDTARGQDGFGSTGR